MLNKVSLQHILPQHILSRLAGKIANSRFKPLKNLFIDIFSKAYNITLHEAIEENPHNYATFNDFFTRKLKEGVRPLAQESDTIISPVDGTILQLGKISENQLIEAKGFNFTVAELLGTNNHKFNNGAFAVIYLAPSNYHRIHAPLNGKLISMTHVPGKLFSVNPKIAKSVPNVFARNERVINIFTTSAGEAAVILVGAMIVGSIETTWAGTIAPTSKGITSWDYGDQEITMTRGEELGKFKLGSTVILLFQENKISWNENLQAFMPIKMGELLGKIKYPI